MPRNWKENTFTCKPRVKASRTGRQHKYKRTPRSLRKLILCDNCRELYSTSTNSNSSSSCDGTIILNCRSLESLEEDVRNFNLHADFQHIN